MNASTTCKLQPKATAPSTEWQFYNYELNSSINKELSPFKVYHLMKTQSLRPFYAGLVNCICKSANLEMRVPRDYKYEIDIILANFDISKMNHKDARNLLFDILNENFTFSNPLDPYVLMILSNALDLEKDKIVKANLSHFTRSMNQSDQSLINLYFDKSLYKGMLPVVGIERKFLQQSQRELKYLHFISSKQAHRLYSL
eukprot:NODE_810_length_3750_cov_0.623939.p2 type:complete len:200 gc:universal NODE_810_length_3750_cov_0.623939:2887-3486(+)